MATAVDDRWRAATGQSDRGVTVLGDAVAGHPRQGLESVRPESVEGQPDALGARIPFAKRAFDVVVAGAGLVASAPVWALASALIKLEDGGPIFYRQTRVGEGGRPFEVLKFRSMIPDAEAAVGKVQSGVDDPRVTRIGRVMRATAMDELPQLWNIFVGDMSFVGPRALLPAETESRAGGTFGRLEDVPGYEARHSVRPGLTGLAQVFAPRDVPRRQKFRYDLLYIRRRSFRLDLGLVALSFWITFRGRWEQRERKV